MKLFWVVLLASTSANAKRQAYEPPLLHTITSTSFLKSNLILASGPIPVRDPPAGYNETYGFPDGRGALIIETPFQYKNGPLAWTDETPLGAYGVISAAGDLVDGQCEPIPENSVFAGSGLKPVPLTNGSPNCMLGCNIADIEAGGPDPCHIGDVTDPSNSPYSCWDLGAGMAGGSGLCGYNCSTFLNTEKHPVPCKQQDLLAGKCSVYCDSRTFPGKQKTKKGKKTVKPVPASSNGVYSPANLKVEVGPLKASPSRTRIPTVTNVINGRGVGARPGGYNTTYGFPDGAGALIIQGPMAYENGPATWSPETPWGAYGMIIIPGELKDGQCTPPPPESVWASGSLKPVPLTNTIQNCLIGCDTKEVARTGVDPCHLADVKGDGDSDSPMSCFELGPGTVEGGGACGYNCTAWVVDAKEPTYCTDPNSGKCAIYCDSRDFPGKVMGKKKGEGEVEKEAKMVA